MREFVIIFKQSQEDIEPGQTVENDLVALKNGSLAIEDLIELVNSGDITVEYQVRDV